MRTYDPLLSDLIPKIFDPPLQPLNFPDTIPQLSDLPLKPLSLNPPPPLYVSIEGRGGTLLLPPVTHAHAPLLPDLHIWQDMPHLLPSNVPATLAHM